MKVRFLCVPVEGLESEVGSPLSAFQHGLPLLISKTRPEAPPSFFSNGPVAVNTHAKASNWTTIITRFQTLKLGFQDLDVALLAQFWSECPQFSSFPSNKLVSHNNEKVPTFQIVNVSALT